MYRTFLLNFILKGRRTWPVWQDNGLCLYAAALPIAISGLWRLPGRKIYNVVANNTEFNHSVSSIFVLPETILFYLYISFIYELIFRNFWKEVPDIQLYLPLWYNNARKGRNRLFFLSSRSFVALNCSQDKAIWFTHIWSTGNPAPLKAWETCLG